LAATTSIVLLALAGLAIALYFTIVYYGRVRGARWVPAALCRGDSICVTILQTPYARILGIPNALLGVAYYSALAVWGLAWHSKGLAARWAELEGACQRIDVLVARGLTLASAVTVLLGFYLLYALRCRLHVHCRLCYAAHIINAVLLLLLCKVAW